MTARFVECRDAACSSIREKIVAAGLQPEEIIGDCFLQLFLCHEWIHQEQRLGSTLYRDSDSYLTAVNVVDYQADLGSIEFVSRILRAQVPTLSESEAMFTLIFVHVYSMHHFTPTVDGQRIKKEYLYRLLVWYFQISRIAQARGTVDVRHPSIVTMPTIVIPRITDSLAPELSRESIVQLMAIQSEARSDIIAALADHDGLVKIYRLASTDERRATAILTAILNEDIALVRSELQEMFDVHPEILTFSRNKPWDRIDVSVGICLDLADRLLSTVKDYQRGLTLDQTEVLEFFERVQLLLEDGAFEGFEPLSLYRDRYRRGAVAAVQDDLVRQLGSGFRAPRHQGAVSDLLRREISRVRVRLKWARDG